RGGGGANSKGPPKTAGEVPFEGRKGSMYLHPMTVNFDKTELDSRYGVYHEVVKTSKVYVRDMTTVTPLMLALFGGSLRVHHEREVITVDGWLKFRAPRRTAALVKHLRVQVERLLLRKITHPQEGLTASGHDIIQAVSMLLRSSARASGMAQDYTPEMLASEINGIRMGTSGYQGGQRQPRQGGWQGNSLQGPPPSPMEVQRCKEEEQKQLRVMQRREQEDAVRRSVVSSGRHVAGGGVPEEELFASTKLPPAPTDTPVHIPAPPPPRGGGNVVPLGSQGAIRGRGTREG
ncbi:unnamed protein product, partial [Discosporangium mesarthrocarpum]